MDKITLIKILIRRSFMSRDENKEKEKKREVVKEHTNRKKDLEKDEIDWELIR